MKPRPTVTFWPAMGVLMFLWLALIYLARELSPANAPLTWIICLTGFTVGIPLGIMASPHRSEASHFQLLGSWVATFASGYVLSKLDSLNASHFATDLQGGRALLFGAFLIIGAVQTFVLRRYLDEARPQDQFTMEAPAPKAGPPKA